MSRAADAIDRTVQLHRDAVVAALERSDRDVDLMVDDARDLLARHRRVALALALALDRGNLAAAARSAMQLSSAGTDDRGPPPKGE